MWSKDLDPYITINNTSSPAFLPVTLDIPGWTPMIHIGTYLPTAGKDTEYLTDLAAMKDSILDLQAKSPAAVVFVRGDCNSSKSNCVRHNCLSRFCSDLGLSRVILNHNTYHHFLGDGAFDSELDVLLFSDMKGVLEEVTRICCTNSNHLVDSHHDLLLSVCSVPKVCNEPLNKSENLVAPKLENRRHKIFWDVDSLHDYESFVSPQLSRIRELWLDSSSTASISILLKTTNMVLSEAASLFNKSVLLTTKAIPRSIKIPASIKRSNTRLARSAKKLRIQLMDRRYSSLVVEKTRAIYTTQKALHKKLVRRIRMRDNIKRDKFMYSVLENEPGKFFQVARSQKMSRNVTIRELHVDDRLYEGDKVCDGFFDSIFSLKTRAHTNLENCDMFNAANQEYNNILKLCSHGTKIPRITLEKTKKILFSLRPDVRDFASITANHYRHAGEAGLVHLYSIINGIIDDLNNLAVDELNIVSACILHKGHGKKKNSSESYRTISSCPFLCRVLDSYIGDLFGHIWESKQASTQFQGKGSSHDLAALLLTETIQFSLHVKKPMFALYLDAKSAFDLVVRQFLINKLYHYGIEGHGLIFFDQRLKNRKTICEWDSVLMGPISDEWGVEQGGQHSSDLYKVFNNSQLETAQDSKLGVDLGGKAVLGGEADLDSGSDNIIFAIGQADDVAIISNDIFAL